MLKAFFKLQQMGPQRCPFLQLQTSDLLLNNRLLTGRLPGEHFFENLSFDFSPWKHSRYSSAKNFFFLLFGQESWGFFQEFRLEISSEIPYDVSRFRRELSLRIPPGILSWNFNGIRL